MLAVAAGSGLLLFARTSPHPQSIRIVLGEAAPRVRELRIRYREAGSNDSSASEDWLRDASFRYAPASAPRIVTHETKLVDGDYLIIVEAIDDHGASAVVEKRVTLNEKAVAIDVAQAVSR